MKRFETSGRWIGSLVLLLAVATAGPATASQDDLRRLLDSGGMEIPARPLPAPPFALPGLDGTPIRLADLQGRAVMLYFWTTW